MTVDVCQLCYERFNFSRFEEKTLTPTGRDCFVCNRTKSAAHKMGISADGLASSKNNVRWIYVAGPMTGREHYNFPMFDKATAHLVSLGWWVVNPAHLDRSAGLNPNVPPPALTAEDMDLIAARDLAAVRRCHAICLLKGCEEEG